MRTRLARLKSSGGVVAAAWFMGDKDESFNFGNVPDDLSTEVEADDFQQLVNCRFIVRGKVLRHNQFREVVDTEDSPIDMVGNLNWCRITILEDDTVGFCLDVSNPRYRLIEAHRLRLTSNESQSLAVFGYLCAASGTIHIDGREIGSKEIVPLSGADITITAGDEGAQVGVLELEYV